MSPLSKLAFAFVLSLAALTACKGPPDAPTPGQTDPTSSNSRLTSSESAGEPLPIRDGVPIPDDLMARIQGRGLLPEDILVTVYFDFDQYNISAAERPKLVTASGTLAGNAGMRVVLVGYTDCIGAEQYNLSLSERRALSVQTFMIDNQAPAGQMQTLAMGMLAATPGVSKTSPEAAKDRCVVVVKIPAGAGR